MDLTKLLVKYQITKDQIDFDYSNMSFEEIDIKLSEIFSESKSNPAVFNVRDGFYEGEKLSKVVFSISHEDIKNSLYNLITQEGTSNCGCYIVTVYDDRFVYMDWGTGNLFGCAYKKDGNNISLDGEPYDVYCEYLTKEQLDKLEADKQDYALIKPKYQEMVKKEENEQKKQLMNKECYAQLSEVQEFKDMKDKVEKEECDLTLQDFEVQLDKCLLDFIKTPVKKEKQTEEEQDSAKKNFSKKAKLPEPEQEEKYISSAYGNFKVF